MKIKKYLQLTFWLTLITFPIFTQNPNLPAQHDHIWMSGYSSHPDFTIVGGTKADFNTLPLTFSYEFREMDFEHTLGIICDKHGGLLFYTNGAYMVNNQDEIIENSEGFNPDTTATQIRLRQGLVILPSTINDDKFYIFHQERHDIDGAFFFSPTVNQKMYYTVVDMNENDGRGKVIEKSIEIINDTLDIGKVTATRHGNGQDWWILAPHFTNRYYFKILFSAQGVILKEPTYVEEPFNPYHGVGQAAFSPDGTKYARSTSTLVEEGAILEVFDFDRCTGELSNQQIISYIPTTSLGKPLAFSPNSRYLYFADSDFYFQFDMWAEDIAESEQVIGIYDGFTYEGIPTPPWMAQLGPDGKIYIATTNTTPYWHVIHDPDLPAAESRLEQHGILLPTFNDGTMSNHPNYRLGPLDGSPCDTLGLDNLPVANFRHDDFLDTIFFRDLSVGAPTDWYWDFGDGTISTEQHFNHIYDSPGDYWVCLTVSNENGSDTWCDTVSVVVTSLREFDFMTLRSFVYPNPTEGMAWLNLEERLWRSTAFFLYDAVGRTVFQRSLAKGEKVFPLDVQDLASGMYFYGLWQEGVKVGEGKLVRR